MLIIFSKLFCTLHCKWQELGIECYLMFKASFICCSFRLIYLALYSFIFYLPLANNNVKIFFSCDIERNIPVSVLPYWQCLDILLRHSRYSSNNGRLSARQCSPPQRHATYIGSNSWRRSDRCMGKEIYGHNYLNYNQELWQLPERQPGTLDTTTITTNKNCGYNYHNDKQELWIQLP